MTSPARLSAMERAVCDGNVRKVQLLLKAGVPADGAVDRWSFVHAAAVCGHPDVFDLLLASGAAPDDDLLLTCAGLVNGASPDIVRRLAAGAASSALDEAWQEAALYGHEDVLAVLVEAGATPGEPPEDDPVEALRAQLAPAARPAWLPEVVPGDADAFGSHFAGTPVLDDGEPWPTCGYCDRPMQLLVQLDLAACPGPGEGMLQVFYCLRPESYCEEVGDDLFQPFGRFQLARVHTPANPVSPAPDPDHTLTPARIVGWRQIADLPAPEEPPERTGVTLTDAQRERLWAQPLTWPADKLGGWPFWVQDATPTPCPTCGEPMRLVLQLGSNDHLDYTFGDAGVARVEQCGQHPTLLAFSWAGG